MPPINESDEKKPKKSPKKNVDVPDYSKENVEKCLNIVVGSLRSSGLKEKANVIQKTFENMSDKVAIPLNLILEGKNNKDKVISSEQAAAMIVYQGYTRSQYQWLKNFTEDLGVGFLPTWKKTKEERDKCVAKDFKCTDNKAEASIKSTLDNYMDRIKQDPEIMTDMTKLREQHGNKIRFQLLYKCGYDGSTQAQYKVRKNFNYLFLSNEALY